VAAKLTKNTACELGLDEALSYSFEVQAIKIKIELSELCVFRTTKNASCKATKAIKSD
jgi:hypothetical protein